MTWFFESLMEVLYTGKSQALPRSPEEYVAKDKNQLREFRYISLANRPTMMMCSDVSCYFKKYNTPGREAENCTDLVVTI